MKSNGFHKHLVELDFWEEITEILLKLDFKDETAILIFNNGRQMEIPRRYIEEDLQKYIGKKLSIMKTDLSQKQFILRANKVAVKSTNVKTISSSHSHLRRQLYD